MTQGELTDLLILLRAHGVTSYKAKGITISLEPISQVQPPSVSVTAPRFSTTTTLTTTPKGSATPLAAIPPVTSAIPHHENEVLSLLRLGDEALVDRIFPDYSNLTPKASEG